jgi:pimeloyl-ACP methyl ester carboxylesterase
MGYDENQALLGENEYRIYYNDANNVLDKPLIIVDGFDPEDTRKIDVIDYEVYNPDEDKSILELMSYNHDNDDNTPNKDLVVELNGLGYDVIIINHNVSETTGIDGGSDYIQRNAYVLISLIRQLKLDQQGTEEMVIIGPSMGGLITRYALAYMEQQLALTNDTAKWDHNTRLWVSFDSPHQGANIPIGVQKGIEFFGLKFGVEAAE